VRDDEDHVAKWDPSLEPCQEVGNRQALATPDAVYVAGTCDDGMDALGLAPVGELVAAGRDRGGAY
jgi:hypothetical protein